MISDAEKAFGAVDVLVNNAGIQFVAKVEDFPIEKWDAVIATNQSAVFHTCRCVLLAVFLAGDAADTITGASYSIDGGWTAQ